MMDAPEMLTALDAGLLAEAFPGALRSEAAAAAETVARQLHERQWTERFPVLVGQEIVLIPARLHFEPQDSGRAGWEEGSLMVRCLQTRSNDGFQRQRALRDLLVGAEPWAVPFVVALMGEYIIEILFDIEAAMSPALLDAITDFIAANPEYWRRTRQRVASYWNVYYRRLGRADYVGFRLVDQLQAALGGRMRPRRGLASSPPSR